MPSPSTPRLPQGAAELTLADYADGVLGWNRAILARAMTLIESNRPDHQEMAQELVNRLLPHTGRSIRVGLTGVPGAGKSALIEALGCRLTVAGHRVTVLAIDPWSVRSGGSLLGDKTKMVRLSADPNAFIRPSPSGLVLGGVARKTRETMLVCEAAGCDVVLIETFGVGQAEASRRARRPHRGAFAGARRAGDCPRPALLGDERLGPRGRAGLMCQSGELTMAAAL